MIKIRVPAGTANLGCGFDIFGMALSCYNYLTISPSAHFEIRINGEGAERLSHTENNMIVRAAAAAFHKAGQPMPNLSFVCENHIPLARGMGSSSAAVIAGIYGANAFMGGPLTKKMMLDLAADLEGHGDNVAAALYGGFVITARNDKERMLERIQVPEGLKAVLVIPDQHISTRNARSALPARVPLKNAVFSLSRCALLPLALAKGDLSAFGSLMEDKLQQPYRLSLIPGGEDALKAARKAGALGCAVSGSGPSLIAFCEAARDRRRQIGEAMAGHLGEKVKIMLLDADNSGATVTY